MPDVIKIDVEGAEVAVLLGGAEVMRHLPTIMCEVAVRNSTAVASGSAVIDTAYTTATCLARSERRSRPLHPTRRRWPTHHERWFYVWNCGTAHGGRRPGGLPHGPARFSSAVGHVSYDTIA